MTAAVCSRGAAARQALLTKLRSTNEGQSTRPVRLFPIAYGEGADLSAIVLGAVQPLGGRGDLGRGPETEHHRSGGRVPQREPEGRVEEPHPMRLADGPQPHSQNGSVFPPLVNGDHMTVERLIRIFAGFFVLASLALGVEASPVFVSAHFLWVTAFVGANLLQSSFTKWCPLEIFLRRFGVQPGC